MQTFAPNRPIEIGFAPLSYVIGFFASFGRALRAAEITETYWRMSDEELADLGLDREIVKKRILAALD